MARKIKRPALQSKGADQFSHRNSTSAASQRQRILYYFIETCPRLTVFEARQLLGIMHLPSRIFELRALGYDIKTEWLTEIDNLGAAHHNGLYIYCGLKSGGIDV